MKTTAEHPAPSAADAAELPRGLADLLAGLERATGEQLDLTRTGQLAAACDLSPLIDALLDAIGAHGPDALAAHAGPITRIRTLHRTLDLTLAQRKDEYTRRRAEVQQGRKLLRTYAPPAPAVRGAM